MSDDLVGHMTKLIAVGLDRIDQLTAERDRLRIALTDAESYLGKGLDKMAYNILRAALKGETP